PLLSLDALAALGVKRVSVGSALARAAMGAFLRGVTEMVQDGTFTFAKAAVPGTRLDHWFAEENNSLRSFEN
ncbi:isocitrate lyase/phosphoenolpyruvate mutase family protein, partial [Paraburkholderia sp. Se-20369]|nr:isocitrate lyase/phosphoenolpyruvate mutase family protein [Paraburkholderia sp. Se-20369]